MPRWTRRLTSLAVLAAAAGFAFAQDAEPDAKAKDKAEPKAPPGLSAKPPTYKVKTAPFRVEITLKGVFESATMTEVAIKPEAWGGLLGGLTVVKAAEPGATVKTGDVLLTLDTEKIDKAIRDLEADQQLAELAIRQAELELPILERTTPLDLAAAERSKDRVEEDLRKFLATDKPLAVESANFQVRNAANALEYAEEELKQLQKMYRKDLTEETEEIILKRQRNQVEMGRFLLKQAENRRDQSLKVDLPRREQDLRDSATKAVINWEKSQSTLPLTLSQKRLALEKARYERAKGAERLADLKKDRELLTVKSPADGIVYYGRCVQGNWPTAAALLTKLQKGGNLSADEVFMTVVQPRPLFVRATVEEKDVAAVTPGSACKVTPAAAPDAKLGGKVEKVGAIPIGGNFEVRVSVDAADESLVPGMACTVKVVPYVREEAVVVPAVAVFEDELNDGKHYVYKVGANGPERRPVAIGKRAGGRAEVTGGLKAGDEILLSKP
jgi:multidrug efflux pump subunit AcrA (membrane-fusion protein)